MKILPKMITFTGVDEWADFNWMAELSMRYPIEWGVLIGGRLGKARYPSLDRINSFAEFVIGSWEKLSRINCSLHLCGDDAQHAMRTLEMPGGLNMGAFGRVQVNALHYDIGALGQIASHNDVDVIMQWRGGDFPRDLPPRVFALHDESGGKGRYTRHRPAAIYSQLVGYAGGINPNNVLDVLDDITIPDKYLNAFPPAFWIDMETGVRTADDRLDLDACELICRKVFREVGTFSVQNELQQRPYLMDRVQSMLESWQRQAITGVYVDSTSTLAISIMTELFGNARVLPFGTVKMPESPIEARAMCLLGESYLRQNGLWPEQEKS